MTALLGYLTIAAILALLLSQRISAVVALAGVPIITGLLAGFTPTEVGGFIAEGLSGIVGITAMFVFAILFFGLMRDAGLFDPVIRRIVRWAGDAPPTVAVATTALALVAHLDGAGAVTFLIAVPAMLPLYDRLGMSRLTLTACVGLGAGVMNVVPWGGPTARAATTLGVDANEIWVPLIPAQIAGGLMALGVAWFLGKREARRLAASGAGTPATAGSRTAVATGGSGSSSADRPAPSAPAGTGTDAEESGAAGDPAAADLRRPRLLWVNAVLTVAVIGLLVAQVASPEMIFIVGAIIALLLNYPGMAAQTSRIQAHATGAMLMASTLLAAGAFLGVLNGTGMITAMAESAAEVVPAGVVPALPLIVGVLGVPLSLLFGPDAYYFGVLPVLIEIGEQFGVSGMDLARASVLGEETLGFPISPLTGAFYLLVGLGGVNIGAHIRNLIGWATAVSVGMLVVAVITGAIPLWAS
ncbi:MULTISPECIES: CitMHS family transporter [unclassified Modestobacter]|uniref:CitMHS family transporter n=1 Tax=unclassified Modestobacter TaxID=2643866 RepID=UPI0022AA3AD5|nr:MULTISPECIES: SLC13 family permease [unclassified Modestobacter]MCZ2813232.1 SLC13 family permease [Modestobacter sp. VKM Ac-2979]MCZ2844848.1 SLC13 family permease [Modestobacter sp. VKM Ac-2980]MCZ2846390.1 SLC13 family permease [Modestobacter sp. VKM Ac-2978]